MTKPETLISAADLGNPRDLMTALQGGDATEVLAHSVAAWVLDPEFKVVDLTPMASRMFGNNGVLGHHFADIFDGTLSWSFLPWVSCETQTDWLSKLFKKCTEDGAACRRFHMATPNRMVYPAIISIFQDPKNGYFWLRIMPYDPYTTGHETGTVMLHMDGSLGGHDGMRVDQEEIKLLRAYAESDNLDGMAELAGCSRRQIDYKIKMLCEKYGCANITQLMKQFMKRHIATVPHTNNTLKVNMTFPNHDRIRHNVLPAHRLPRESGEVPPDMHLVERQRNKFGS